MAAIKKLSVTERAALGRLLSDEPDAEPIWRPVTVNANRQQTLLPEARSTIELR